MALRRSFTRSVAPRRWRRILASSTEARSAISSSEIMAVVMSSSRLRKEPSSPAFSFRRGVFSRSVTRAARAVRQARMSPAISSSALGDRVAPLSHKFR